MLQPQDTTQIPWLTQQVAKAAFPNGSLAMTLRDELGPIFEDADFAELYPATGQPAESPARLALITILQFAEDLPDRQAADAVRGRIDWKYALGLELSDSGFHYSVLSEFRQRLAANGKERLLLDKLLERCAELELLKGKHKQRTDSTHVIAAVRGLTLLELVGETMRYLLNSVAQVAPEWLRTRMSQDWISRYERHFEAPRLPRSVEERAQLAVQIGLDGLSLFQTIQAEGTPQQVKVLPMVEVLRRIWIQQFYIEDGQLYWRAANRKKWGQPPANQMIASPLDLDISYCVKRSTEWIGYRVHLTETCDPEHPRLITQVRTTTATTHDVKATQPIQDDLASRDLLPETHLVDQGYTEVDLLVSSQQRGVDLVGPVPSHKSWQSRTEEAFDHTQFHIDWKNKQATCPGGKVSRYYADRKTWRGTPNVLFAFDAEDCQPCPLREQCTRAQNVGRTLTVYSQGHYQAQEQARKRQETEEFKALYSHRAGIEGTISQGVRSMGLRQSRYIGLARTHLQHVATAAAINVERIVDWLAGESPETTRISPLRELASAA
jgi:transposase